MSIKLSPDMLLASADSLFKKLQSQSRTFVSRLSGFLTDKHNLILGIILALGAFLRLWNLPHLFNIMHDYDEASYSLGARFMTEGYHPYTDFTLVHPPLYNLVLSGIYRIFGYDFMYGKYLSVALALLSIVLIYTICKKLYHPTAGLAAALLFAVSTDMVYPGRRVVQESLGIFLILLAVYLAVIYLKKHKSRHIVACGLFLGLAIATKYIFIPAAIGIILAVIVLNMPETFRKYFNILGKGSFWLVYLACIALLLSLMLTLKWIFKVPITIPFIDDMYLSAGNVIMALITFLLPLIPACRLQLPEFKMSDFISSLIRLLKQNMLWLLLCGLLAGFLSVAGYYLVTSPSEFIQQTFILQTVRSYSAFPSFLAILGGFFYAPAFLKVAYLPILLALPLVILILRKQDINESDYFIGISLLITFIFCQFFYQLPRYYISATIFVLLSLPSFMPALDAGTLRMKLADISAGIKMQLLTIVTAISFSLCITLVLLTNYTGYDSSSTWMASDEEYVYTETVSYLEQAEAQKIYATDPIFPAFSKKLNSTLYFDSFELLFLENQNPDDIVANRISEGVDYIILDSWVRWWGGDYKEQSDRLVQAVRRHGRLVKIIAAGEPTQVEIYCMTPGYSVSNHLTR
jgi:4-amino-4-deoxy-L-arabinose transferase-like glycosyltransferase